MKTSFLHIPLRVLAAAAMLSALHADPVSTIHSTGDGISVGGQDLYYTIVANPGGPVTQAAYATSPGTSPSFPFQAWGSNGPNSKWISPQASYTSAGADAVGSWTFQTTFDLTGYVASSLSFGTAEFWADNQLTGIFLNGYNIGYTANVSPTNSNFPSSTSFASLLNAAIPGHILAGVNTLSFVVNNYSGATGNPVGLQVNLSTVSATPVPEPAALGLVAATALSFVVFRRRTRAS